LFSSKRAIAFAASTFWRAPRQLAPSVHSGETATHRENHKLVAYNTLRVRTIPELFRQPD
jgi:hypothetical protein